MAAGSCLVDVSLLEELRQGGYNLSRDAVGRSLLIVTLVSCRSVVEVCC